MRDCPICEHPQRAELEEACRAGQLKGLRERYGVHHMMVLQHLRWHRPTPASLRPEQSADDDIPIRLLPPTSEAATVRLEQSAEPQAPAAQTGLGQDARTLRPEQSAEPQAAWSRRPMFIHRLDAPLPPEWPLSQFKLAWASAQDDPPLRAKMVAWLNDQLQADEMGLP